jgi:hypothetical protein
MLGRWKCENRRVRRETELMLLHRSLSDDKIQNCRLCKSQGAVLLTNSGIYKDASERGSALYGMTLKGSVVPVVVFSLTKSVSPPRQDVVTRYFCLKAIAHSDDVDKHVKFGDRQNAVLTVLRILKALLLHPTRLVFVLCLCNPLCRDYAECASQCHVFGLLGYDSP